MPVMSMDLSEADAPEANSILPNVIGQNPAFPQPTPAIVPPSLLSTFQVPPGALPYPGMPMAAGLFPPPFGPGGAPQPLPGQAGLPGIPGQPAVPLPLPQAPLPETDFAMMEDVDELSFGVLEPQYILPATRVAHYIFEENDQKPTILAGSDRSVFWTRPLETRADHPPMRNLLGYTSKINHVRSSYAAVNGIAPTTIPADTQEEWGLEAQSTQTAQGEENMRDGRLKQLSLPNDFVTAVQVGTQNVAFDESSCKLCIVADKPTRLFYLDYAV